MSEMKVRTKMAIVDDEKDLVDVYLRLFRNRHMDVCFVAGNGLDAVESYRKAAVRPDIVIMDYRMPLMNGIEAMRVIRSLGGPVKFIFLSADASVRDEATQMGAIFLKKPASLRELLQAVEALSGRPADPGSHDRAADGGFFPGTSTW
jgi:two-component system, chemotaxis family, chemotaxis protein CheY